jgi:flavodoxin
MTENILIAYFSHSENTLKMAKMIHNEVGGTLFEIQPEVAYPSSYNDVLEQAKKEIQANYKPALKSKIDHIELYDTIFVGSPNWWSTIAPPVVTFLSEYDLSGKTIVPFCTHGGGGQGRISDDIKKLCPRSTILDCFGIYGSDTESAQTSIFNWLRKINEL